MLLMSFEWQENKFLRLTLFRFILAFNFRFSERSSLHCTCLVLAKLLQVLFMCCLSTDSTHLAIGVRIVVVAKSHTLSSKCHV